MTAVVTQTSDRVGEMLMDPSFQIGMKWYTGLVSNLGILAWTVAVAAAFAGVWLCRLGGRRNAALFLLGGGVVGSLLLFDDLLMLHAVLLPSVLGIPKVAGQALIGGALAAWVMLHSRELFRTPLVLLVAAGSALAASYVVDSVFAPLPGTSWNVIEDGAKFLGALAWAAYFVVTARDISRSVFAEALMTWPDAAFDSLYGEHQPSEPVG